MACVDDLYLPDVAKVFAGEASVFSWDQTLQVFRKNNLQPGSIECKVLQSSAQIKNVLSQKVPLFRPPSQQSKTSFETKTSAVNVPPSTDRSYDITQIKTDTSWLSAEVKIAEEEALRICMLVWEQQPQQRILAGYSDVELASLRDALGGQNDANGDLFFHLPSRSDDEFDSDFFRKRRILFLYSREQAAMVNLMRELQQIAMVFDPDLESHRLLRELALRVEPTKTEDAGLKAIFDAIELRLQSINARRSWTVDGVEIEDLWLASEYQLIQQLLEVLLLRIRASPQLTVPGDVILQWFHIAAGCEFFSLLSANDYMSSELVQHLQTTAAVLSAALLDPASSVAMLSSPTASPGPNIYFLNTNIATEITHILLAASEGNISQAAPASLTWALILEELRRTALTTKELREQKDTISNPESTSIRRTSYGSLQQSVYEDLIDHILTSSSISDVIAYLLRCSIEINRALDVLCSLANFEHQASGLLTAVKLQVLQEIVTVCVPVLGYNPDVLEAQFALLNAPSVYQNTPDIRDTFIKNDFLMDAIFAVAAGRFPYETTPFLRLCRLLSSAQIYDEYGTNYITYRLRAIATFTQLATGDFAHYHTVREDENLNLVALDRPASVISELTVSSVVAEQTIGEVISESVPPVVRWQHAYSAFAMMGTWLESYRSGAMQNTMSPNESPEIVVTEIIALFYTLLRNTVDQVEATANMKQQQQDDLLAEFSSGLQHDSDVTDCLFDIMEQQLQNFRRKPSNTFDTSVLIACVNFMSILVRIRPQKFWALFSRTTLLESFGSDSFLLSLITGVEAPGQNYPLLSSCCLLYKNMITSALPVCAVKSTPHTPQTTKLQASLLLSLTQTLYVIYDRLPNWAFASSTETCSIVSSLSESFVALMIYSHGSGEDRSMLKRPFIPANMFLERQFQTDAETGTELTAPFQHLLKMTELGSSQWSSPFVEPRILPYLSLISLAQNLVKVGRLRSKVITSLEIQLFNGLPILLRIMSSDASTLAPICDLIQTLLEAVQGVKPISLLGHLGSTSSICLVEILKRSQAVSTGNTKTQVWALLACLVSQKQRWLALVLLTGSTPDTGGNHDRKPMTGKSIELRGQNLVDTALDLLLKIVEVPPKLTVALLKFIIEAQQNWSWISSTPKLKTKLLPGLISYVRDTFVDRSSPLKVSYKNKITSLVTNLATTYLHYSKVMQEKDSARIIMSLLFYFAENPSCVDVASYNLSLHANLKRNFSAKYPDLDVNDFRHTRLAATEFGDDFYYDVGYLQQVLGNPVDGASKKKTHDHSFADEFRRANLNLSVVESELELLRNFKLFCIQHGTFFVQNGPHPNAVRPKDLFSTEAIYNALTKIVISCLSANSVSYPSQEIFEALFESRAELTIALLQRLVDAKAKGFDIKGLLNKAWTCAQYRNRSYEEALTNNDLSYWRSTLTIVLLAMQFHCGGKWSPPAFNHEPSDMLRQELTNITPTILEIMHVVVGRGFRSVAAALQQQQRSNSFSKAQPTLSIKDLLLNLSLLNTMLRLTRSAEYVTEVSDRLMSSEIVESCLLLYSWSHTLTEPGHDNEPVYAEICLQYLSALSSMPPIAEHLGVEGVLSRLLNAQVTQRIRNIPEGARPLDKRQAGRFMYSLWVQGLLPICLNLLHSIGAPVAAEVSVFLNQFPEQLSLASSAFIPAVQSKTGGGGTITLYAAREAALLSLISYILDSYREAGASSAIDPTMVIPLASYDEHKKALAEDLTEISTNGIKDRVLAVTDEEIEWSKIKEGASNRLDSKVLYYLRNALTCLKGQNSEVEER